MVASSFRIAALLIESIPSSVVQRRVEIVADDYLMASKLSLSATPLTYLFASGNTLLEMWFCKNLSGCFLRTHDDLDHHIYTW